jgi:hypothetical protein
MVILRLALVPFLLLAVFVLACLPRRQGELPVKD